MGAALVWAVVLPAAAVSWDSCADELDGLRSAAEDATDAANEVESESEELENCRQFPDIYDYFRDGCSGQLSDYRSAVSNLESELDTIARRVRSVSNYCGVEVSSRQIPAGSRTPKQSHDDRMCELLRSYRGKVAQEDLTKTCLRSLKEPDCTKCLSQ